jgi:hypothetical protein
LNNLGTTGAMGILMLTAVACAHHPANFSDRSEANLSGPVQSILDKDPFFVTFLSFNRAGNLTEMTRECIDEAACTDGPRSTSMKFKMDDSGRKVSAEEQEGNGLTRFREAYSFDEAGHLSARIRALPEGEFLNGDFYWYDHRGNRVGEITVLNIRELAGEITFLNVRELVGSDSMAEKSEYFYDVQGRATKQVKYDSKGRKRVEVVKTYDNSGHLYDETSSLPEGGIARRVLYDHQGAKFQELAFDGAGELYLKYEYSYEYDQLNNWTKRLMKVWEKRDGVLTHTYTMVHERIISYYP